MTIKAPDGYVYRDGFVCKTDIVYGIVDVWKAR